MCVCVCVCVYVSCVCVCRAVNNEVLDTYQLKSLDGVIEVDLEKQRDFPLRQVGHNKFAVRQRKTDIGDGKKTGTLLWSEQIPLKLEYDTVIRCTGFEFDFTLFG